MACHAEPAVLHEPLRLQPGRRGSDLLGIMDEVARLGRVGDAADAEALCGERLGEPPEAADVARAARAEHHAREGHRLIGGREEEVVGGFADGDHRGFSCRVAGAGDAMRL
jgi:hypothetical protein